MKDNNKRTPLLDFQNVGLILLAALTAFSVVYVYIAYSIDMSPADGDILNYIAPYILICVIGGAVSTYAALITFVYLHLWRNRFPRYVDVLLSIGFGLVSIMAVLIVRWLSSAR